MIDASCTTLLDFEEVAALVTFPFIARGFSVSANIFVLRNWKAGSSATGNTVTLVSSLGPSAALALGKRKASAIKQKPNFMFLVKAMHGRGVNRWIVRFFHPYETNYISILKAQRFNAGNM
jgi:hypothetical protein